MKKLVISLALLAGLSLPVYADEVIGGHVLLLSANVDPAYLPGVRVWAAKAVPFASLAAPLLPTGVTGGLFQRVAVRTAVAQGTKSFAASDAAAVAGCNAMGPPAGFHCEVIARVKAK